MEPITTYKLVFFIVAGFTNTSGVWTEEVLPERFDKIFGTNGCMEVVIEKYLPLKDGKRYRCQSNKAPILPNLKGKGKKL